ncbi:MAG TPA: hypothetical protein DCF33_14255 [Saprospirales bacterium]|nr:hypothetical protein [Saprospirales bacterium]
MHTTALQKVRFPAILLLGLLLFQSAGWQMAWHGMHWNARWEARNALFQDNNLPEKTFSKAFFAQIKVDKKEIRLEGFLYDFYTVAETEDSIRVALYHDHKEQALLSALGHMFQSGEQSGQSSAPFLNHWLALSLGVAFLVPPVPVWPKLPVLALSRAVFPACSWGTQFVPGVFAPPPEGQWT